MSSFLLGPIIGGLSHNSVNLWARSSGPATLHAWLGEQADLSDARLVGKTHLGAQSGFAGIVAVNGLVPDRRYFYTLTMTDNPPNPALEPYPSFRTAPIQGVPFSFAFGSCYCPLGETDGHIFESLSKRIRMDDLRFVIMLGDQIYADQPHCHNSQKIAVTLQDYRQVYEFAWSRKGLKALLEQLPAFMILDDHEVDDDWAWLDFDRLHAQIPWWNRFWRWLMGRTLPERTLPRERVQNALQTYWEHQGMHAPRPVRIPQLTVKDQFVLDRQDPGSLAYKFKHGGAAFFVLDTRTHRVRGHRGRQMLGEDQWLMFENWLQETKDQYTHKFVVTSSSLLGNFLFDLASDRWSGFPDEQRRMMELIANHGINGVIFLTGDLHSAHAIRVDLQGSDGATIPVWEFCSSPFKQEINTFAKCGWLLRHTKQGPIKSGKVYWIETTHNFGVVKYEHRTGGKSFVRFTLYDSVGKEINTATTNER